MHSSIPGLASALAALLVGSLQAQAAPAIELSGQQREALGVGSEASSREVATVSSRYPARVNLPAERQRVVSTPQAALVEAVLVAPGDAVKAGQPLARLRSAAVQELQRDALQAASQAELARSAFERDQKLLDEGVISQSRFDATRAAHRQAATLADERRRQLAALGGGDPSALDGLLQLRSPMAGVVLESMVLPGARVEPATALMKIASLEALVLELQVPVSEAASLRLGDAVRAPGASSAGRIVGIGQAVDPSTQSLVVRALVKNEGTQALRPGQLTEAQVERRSPAARRIAASALVRHEGRDAVFVEDAPGRFRMVPVRVSGTSAGMAVVEGLAGEVRVVVKGTAALLALARS